MTPPAAKPAISIYQLVDVNGRPYMACHAEPLWVDRTQTNVFSVQTAGNKIVPFTTGQAYFDNLIVACDGAVSEICIAGWQVNWDAQLAPGLRLYDLLYRCAGRGVHIYVMPWDDTEPVQTYEDQTKAALESINMRLAKAGATGRVHVALCPSFAGTNNTYFSHHQKQVVIDRKTAYVGGIDLAYGRMDDAKFDLHADAQGRQMLNRYNPGIPPLKTYPRSNPYIVDPDLMVGATDTSELHDAQTGQVLAPSNAKMHGNRAAAGGWQVRYEKAGLFGIAPNSSAMAANTAQYTTLDPALQPRMPWQDVHCRIDGPAVSDLLRNFVLRWNIVARKKLAMPASPKAYPQPGKTQIQVLRSAPAAHCTAENKANRIKDGEATQQDIYVSMKKLIAKARHFIYIEQQFFVSDFGKLGGPQDALSPAAQYIKDGADGISSLKLHAVRKLSNGDASEMDRLPQNGVLKALLARFKEIIVDDVTRPKFHVYITLPVHPEGALCEASIAVQVYYTMQTLVFGSHSLINGLKRLIKARELKDKNDADHLRVWADAESTEHESITIEACHEYVTLLNLRNWAQLGTNYVTEQIYVHSKLMIVDDRFALIGSANINDRSLLGERDSELAVLVMDDECTRADVLGKGSNQPVRVFAHELRKELWSKLFGITGGVRPATDLQSAIDEPGNPESWKKIQARAEINKTIYEAAFPFVPRDFSTDKVGNRYSAKILPTWVDQESLPQNGTLTSRMPFENAFWGSHQHTISAKRLSSVTGYITAFPFGWTSGENIRIKYPTAIIVQSIERTGLPASREKTLAAQDGAVDDLSKGHA